MAAHPARPAAYGGIDGALIRPHGSRRLFAGRREEDVTLNLCTDPIDDDPRYAAIIAEAAQATEEELADIGISCGMGYCYPAKKQTLKERFGIDSQTPAELNPDVIFD